MHEEMKKSGLSKCKIKTLNMRGSRIFFFRKGVGVQARRPENSLNKVFFFYLVLNLFYSLRRGSNGLVTEKTILFQ